MLLLRGLRWFGGAVGESPLLGTCRRLTVFVSWGKEEREKWTVAQQAVSAPGTCTVLRVYGTGNGPVRGEFCTQQTASSTVIPENWKWRRLTLAHGALSMSIGALGTKVRRRRPRKQHRDGW